MSMSWQDEDDIIQMPTREDLDDDLNRGDDEQEWDLQKILDAAIDPLVEQGLVEDPRK